MVDLVLSLCVQVVLLLVGHDGLGICDEFLCTGRTLSWGWRAVEGKAGGRQRRHGGRQAGTQPAFRALVASEKEGDPGSIPSGGVTKPARSISSPRLHVEVISS